MARFLIAAGIVIVITAIVGYVLLFVVFAGVDAVKREK